MMEMLPALNGIGPILYDRIPAGDGAQTILYRTLYQRLVSYDQSLRGDLSSGKDTSEPPSAGSSLPEEPSFSTSRGNGHLYGAMSGLGHVGCHYTARSEFEMNFPVGTAFLPEEWGRALNVQDQPESAAALLWSVKEAVVKALGTSFHYYDPLEFEVELMEARENGFLNIIRAQQTYAAWSVFQEEGCFSLAVVRRQLI